jgi:asparagine synthase (glutamine-hydrolysing)
MSTPDQRYLITYNGEVYNWPEIRKELRFQDWRSQTDTETILHAFAERGAESLSLFNGIFAFAIWDRKDKQLFLARDRAGIKPLFWAFQDATFFFGSEAKAIHAAGFPKRPEMRSVWEFLRWGIVDHSENTFFEGIRSLMPGQQMVVRPGEAPRITPYWDLPKLTLGQPLAGYEEAKETYRDLLVDSIRIQCRADVPIGTGLSSGVDSSALTACVAQQLPNRKLHCFTYHFGDDEGEGTIARETARILDANITLSSLRANDVPSCLSKVLFHQEAPVTSIRVLAMHRLYEEVRRSGVTVLLEGSGGDEMGSGYEYYYVPYVMDLLTRADGSDVMTELFRFMDAYRIPQEARLNRFVDCLRTVLRPGVSTQDGVTFVAPQCLHPDFQHFGDEPNLEGCYPDWLRRLQYIDFRHIVLPRALRYTDRASMASSVEVREPILDHRLIEFSFRTDASARIGRGHQRMFMKAAAEQLLPASILQQPKKTVVDPQRKWLRDELSEWVLDTLHSPCSVDLPVFNTKNVLKEFERYRTDPQPRTSFHIFQFVNVITWFRTFFP